MTDTVPAEMKTETNYYNEHIEEENSQIDFIGNQVFSYLQQKVIESREIHDPDQEIDTPSKDKKPMNMVKSKLDLDREEAMVLEKYSNGSDEYQEEVGLELKKDIFKLLDNTAKEEINDIQSVSRSVGSSGAKMRSFTEKSIKSRVKITHLKVLAVLMGIYYTLGGVIFIIFSKFGQDNMVYVQTVSNLLITSIMKQKAIIQA
jgi:hypothetical protein